MQLMVPPQQIQLISDGTAGTAETLSLMRGIVIASRKNGTIRTLASTIVRNLPGKRWVAEIKACFDYVQQNIRYTMDVNGIETLQIPTRTLEIGVGDCDDMCTLLASLLESIGHHCRFVAVGFDPAQEEYSHVFLQTVIPDTNNWISLDPSEQQPMGWKPPGIQSCMVKDV